MYSLDVNFLKDRPEYRIDKGSKRSKSRLPTGNQNFIYLGLAVGIFLPALIAACWLFTQNQNTELENKIAQIDAEANSLGTQEQQIKKIQEETNKTKGETQALATVFNQIRPWSATLQDLRDRIPATARIESIKQTASSAPQQGQPAANPTGGIEISGIASSFNDVNDFLLTVQQSPFFKGTNTKLVTAELIDSPLSTAGSASQSATSVPVKPLQVVRYTIQSSLSDVPASQLIRELERKGTSGLVTRIRTLQKIGVIQP